MKVSWVWVVQGGTDASLYEDELYPGDDAVDWIAWDPFN
jgi:beta-mannanase